MTQLTAKAAKRVIPIEDWGWWFKVGETYDVAPYPYRATRGATLDWCQCSECRTKRDGKDLFDMYVVVSGPKRGSIIPVAACRDAATH